MAIQQRTQTSIMLTFKILQFVKQLRRRVTPRVFDGSIETSNLGVQAPPTLRKISDGLFRISMESSVAPVPAIRNVQGDKLQQMLGSVDSKLRPAESVFSAVAGDNNLFLQHSNASILEGCSMCETVQKLAVVHDALSVLSDCRLQYGDDWLLAQGLDAGLDIDENFIANFEHMLLRLQAELIEALARKALEALLGGGHDKKQRKLLAWFTEFAEKPQCLGASFPWTIKPALAVLWGVCWMFYDEEIPRGGVRLDKVLQNLDLPWDTEASSDYLDLGRELIGGHPRHATHPAGADVQVGLDSDLFPPRNTGTCESELTSDPDRLTNRLPVVVVSHAVGKCPVRYEDTYYGLVAQDFSIDNHCLPPQNQGPAAPLTVFPHLGSDYDQNPWHSYTLPQDGPRHLIASESDPAPRVGVTGAAESGFFAQPQTAFASPSIYQLGRQPHALPHHPNSSFNNYYADPRYIMADTQTVHDAHQHQHKRTISTVSINSATDMPTPVSLSGPRSPLMSPTASERTHMLTSPQSQTHSHSRGISVDSSQDGDDHGSLRKNHSYKRAEEAPRNQDGKMVCKYQECRGLYFDRKCEWSKHMDKHDRPYKCNVKGCEKLQGFTYSGGLLRHEREVHKMHGGTNKSLFCPVRECKRSSGAGFTRKENLAEHIRRVHRRTSMSVDMGGMVITRRGTSMEGSPIAESRIASESPYNRAMDYHEDDDGMSLKRKRGGSDAGFSDRGNEDMRAEIKRLRQENEEKDSRLHQLEQAVMALQKNCR
ncbi:hypothetical protein BDW02DRAFT_508425 [Decorospora gaudefroyi]|uniref:C2H2-type domain-containing protein n=1 Tax=Decorospora gaudefroyi TaxID=184978 RepID=A0A6A5K6H8_9PLEO|nr:hypothetical protein BDW02DRAFT_508425 [Decorospora gaudefroyi]